jgi:hypothetical protein
MKHLIKQLVTATLVCSATAALAQPNGNGSQNVPQLTGWWSSAGGGTAQFFQEGKKVTALFVTPTFAHKTIVGWDSASLTFTGSTKRADGCTLQLNIKLEPQSDSFLLVSASLDPAVPVPACSDLVPGQIYYDTNTKIPGT